MNINLTPIRTSKNYGINDFVVPDNLFDKNFEIFENIKISGNMKIEKTNAVPTNAICQQVKNQLSVANSKLKFVANKNQTMQIEYTLNQSQNLASILELQTKENSNAKCIVKIDANYNSFCNSFIKCNCEKNSTTDIYVICDTTVADANLVNIEILAQENSNAKLFVIDFASKYSISKIETNVQKNAKCAINHIYIGENDEKIDINTIQNIYGENATATTNVVGALFDDSTKNFKGTIDFKQGSKKSKASENEYCMLISKNAKSKAMPILLSQEDDVDGSHSSATGKIDQKELFYCMSRGMTKKESTKLLVKAKFYKILSQMDAEIQQEIAKRIDMEIDDDK